MSVEVIAIGLTLLVHVIGAGVLIWALVDGDSMEWRGWWPRDDDDGRGGRDPFPEPPAPPRGGVPLPDAVPSKVRLRMPGRIADAHPQPARRPEHTPERERTPAG